jgi:hypothetical protein
MGVKLGVTAISNHIIHYKDVCFKMQDTPGLCSILRNETELFYVSARDV